MDDDGLFGPMIGAYRARPRAGDLGGSFARSGGPRQAGLPSAGAGSAEYGDAGRSDPQRAVSDLYQAHALGLIRLAVVMLGDRPAAEDVVQEALRSACDRGPVHAALRGSVARRPGPLAHLVVLSQNGMASTIASAPCVGITRLSARPACARSAASSRSVRSLPSNTAIIRMSDSLVATG